MKKYIIIPLFVIFGLISNFVHALDAKSSYERIDAYYKKINEHSMNPIRYGDMSLKCRYWTQANLKEKANAPFFAVGSEITQAIIDGVKNGELIPYVDENFMDDKRMSVEAFFEKLKLEGSDDVVDTEFSDSDGAWGNKSNASKDKKVAEVAHYLAKDISTLVLVEDFIIDKIRACAVLDIVAVTLVLPANLFKKGFSVSVATFKYKDLVEYLNTLPLEKSWVEEGNNVRNIPFPDAIKNGLLDKHIIRRDEIQGRYLIDIYDGDTKKALYAALAEENNRLLMESNLWVY